MLSDYKNKLSIISVSLHWVIALYFIGMIGFGLYIEGLPRSPDKFQLLGLHKSLGMVFFLLAISRIAYRFTQGFPAELGKKPEWQKKIARLVHWCLIVATLLVPISGILMSVGDVRGLSFFGTNLVGRGDEILWASNIGHAIHGIAPKVMILIIVLHAAAAIKQQRIDKSLSRMLGISV